MNTKYDLINLKNIPSNLLNNFDCGNDIINDYFKNKAIDDDDVTTFGFLNDQNIVSLVSLCCTGIMLESSNKIQIIPAVEIKMFATSENYQHGLHPSGDDYKWSEYCLDKTIAFIINFTENYCGASKIVLYSVPNAVNFYIRSGFQNLKNLCARRKNDFLTDVFQCTWCFKASAKCRCFFVCFFLLFFLI